MSSQVEEAPPYFVTVSCPHTHTHIAKVYLLLTSPGSHGRICSTEGKCVRLNAVPGSEETPKKKKKKLPLKGPQRSSFLHTVNDQTSQEAWSQVF